MVNSVIVKEINQDIWGKKENWTERKSYNNFIIKMPDFWSLADGRQSERLSDKPIDDSICMFGLVGDSDLLTQNAVNWYQNNPIIKTENHDVSQIFYLSAGLTETYRTYSSMGYETRSSANTNIWNRGVPISSKFSNVALDFPYNRCIILIKVTCMKSDGSESKNVSYSAYKTTYSTDYPLITSIYPEIYQGSLTNRAVTNTGLAFPCTHFIYPTMKTEYGDVRSISYSTNFDVCGIGIYSAKGITKSTIYPNSTVRYFNGSAKRWDLRHFESTDTSYPDGQYIPIFTGIEEDIYKQASYWGLYFTADPETARSAVLGENCTSDLVCLPVITNGTLTGKYERGKKTADLPNSRWDSDLRDKTGYKGKEEATPLKYTDKIPLSSPKITAYGAFNNFYALSESELKAFASEIWTADDDRLSQFIKGLQLMGENPINAIISLSLYPFDIKTISGSVTDSHIKLGRTSLNSTGSKVKNLNPIIDMGYISLRNYFDNFLDFEPYSTAFLYIPYCGVIQLSLNDFIGKVISIKLICDFLSGVCRAVIFADGIPMLYKSGVIGTSISVTGTDSATMSSNLINNSLSVLTNATNLVAGGDVSTVIKNSASFMGSAFDYSAMRTIYDSQGSTGTQISIYEPQKPYLVINLPNFDIDDSYGLYHGYRCDFYEFINTLTGYIETDTPILTNISATEEEKNLIIDCMRGGIYV